MRIAIDPHMHRNLSLEALPCKVKEHGFDRMELARRGAFLEWFKAPRVFPERVRSFEQALEDADVRVASLLPMYRRASNDEVERLAAVRHWKRAIEIRVELGVDTMTSATRSTTRPVPDCAPSRTRPARRRGSISASTSVWVRCLHIFAQRSLRSRNGYASTGRGDSLELGRHAHVPRGGASRPAGPSGVRETPLTDAAG